MADENEVLETSDSTDDIDVDALLSSIENGEDVTPKETAAPEKVAATPAPTDPEYEYTWSGQKIKEPLSKILQKASMGHDYSQKMQAFKSDQQKLSSEQQKFNEERSTVEKLKSEYGSIDEWVKQNPDKWGKLQAIVDAEQKGYGDLPADHPLLKELNQLKSELTGRVLPFIQEKEQEKIKLQHAKEDEAFAADIKSIRDKYKDLDWDNGDEQGRNMESRVLDHGVKHGFKSFRAAFLDLNAEHIEKLAETRGRESLSNERIKNAKLGLLGKTSAPMNGVKKAVNLKQKSYDELAREGLEEFGIAT